MVYQDNPFIGRSGYRVDHRVALESINKKLEEEPSIFGDVIKKMLNPNPHLRPSVDFLVMNYRSLFKLDQIVEPDEEGLTTPASAPDTPLSVTITSPLIGHLESSKGSPVLSSRSGPSPLHIEDDEGLTEEDYLDTSDDED